ncbi:MAG: substrate-binding domain-containing protein [Spirochaetales bacterium]|nr:substrate-binding domain-containing protein [Spirochaetales bacterium]
MNVISQTHKKRITFGLLTDSTESSYHIEILSGITDFVQEHDINLLIFVGGALQSANIYEYDRNKLYFLANSDNVDGLLVLTPTLGLNIGPRGMRKMLNAFHPLPIVSLATQLPRITSVVIDNKAGMRDLLTHFIEDHGCRRFACIRGPAHVHDAEERFQVFKEILKKFNLPLENNLIVQGPYGTNFGIKAIKQLLDTRRVRFDAIIASNDDTALGIMEELKRRRISVPQEIKIAGFDDIIESRSFIPRLTTVHQPIYRIGRTACATLYNLIKGRNTDILTKLPTELVIRESCGCKFMERIKSLSRQNEKQYFVLTKKSFLKEFGYLDSHFKSEAQKTDQLRVKKTLDNFLNKAILTDSGYFLQTWRELLKSIRRQQYSFSIIHRIYHILREHLFPLIYKYRNSSYLSNLNTKTEEMLENLFLEWEMDQKIQNSDVEVKLRELYEELHTVLELHLQMDCIFNSLSDIGIKDCYLSLFVNPNHPLNNARLLLAYKNGCRLHIKDSDSLFTSHCLVPKRNLIDVHARHTMIVSSLFYGEEQLGFMLYNFIGWAPNPYEDLRMILSSAIKNALLSDKMKHLAMNLKTLDHNQHYVLFNETEALTGADHQERCADLRIQRAVDFMLERYNTDITLNDGANKAFMSATYFSRIFKQIMGKGFLQYLTSLRIEKACSFLKTTGLKISEIARSVGYHDADYFYKIFKKATGCTPGMYRKK